MVAIHPRWAAGLLIAATLWSGRALAADAKPTIGFSPQPPAAGPRIKTDHGYMVPYTATIPGTKISFEMVPIPGGKFLLGSPNDEPGRAADEGPRVEIEVEPFWMGKYEVTWGEFRHYMDLHGVFKDFETAKIRVVDKNNEADAVTAPSIPYEPEFHFQFGADKRLPAATMSQFSAKQYTKLLSKLTGQTYRLPAAAEWEYACRAGTTTAYFFGDEPAKLDQYAWRRNNSQEKTHPVGQKKPNPWGLYDMYGNVSEWVLDEPRADGYQRLVGKTVKAWDSIAWPTKIYPRHLKGGDWDSVAAACRSAALRRSDDRAWNDQDPDSPPSPQWYTGSPALGVGFRIVRPLHSQTARQLELAWDADVEQLREDVRVRIHRSGRGVRGLVDPGLPAAIEKFQTHSPE